MTQKFKVGDLVKNTSGMFGKCINGVIHKKDSFNNGDSFIDEYYVKFTIEDNPELRYRSGYWFHPRDLELRFNEINPNFSKYVIAENEIESELYPKFQTTDPIHMIAYWRILGIDLLNLGINEKFAKKEKEKTGPLNILESMMGEVCAEATPTTSQG